MSRVERERLVFGSVFLHLRCPACGGARLDNAGPRGTVEAAECRRPHCGATFRPADAAIAAADLRRLGRCAGMSAETVQQWHCRRALRPLSLAEMDRMWKELTDDA